ncbi:MAG: mannose-1-phosphate guanylyltransferase [Bacteroidota bacterium]
MTYAVIMAGGIGTRFWPASRQAHPKQFLNVFGEATLIQNTVARLQGIIPPERCLIVTHERYIDKTRAQLPAVPPENILGEPISRNTAPCIAYAAAVLAQRDPEATMVVLPADHVITDVARFHTVLKTAIATAQQPGAIVTIGVTPTHPATGYGYIQFEGQVDPASRTPKAFSVRAFAEKPDERTAERFVDSGDFLWNSGMFIWRVDSISDQLRQHLPTTFDAFLPVTEAAGTPKEADAVLNAFKASPKISIDYGVMEKAEDVYVVPGSFGWNDVGDWRAVYNLQAKDDYRNAADGKVILHNAEKCYVQAKDRLIVLVGMRNTIVVETDDAVLVCKKSHTQEVKHVVEYLHEHNMTDYV